MTRRSTRSLLVACVASLVLAAPIAGASIAPQSSAHIGAQVTAELAAKGETTAWVILKAKADLSRAFGIADWNARGQFVYDALTTTAKRSQKGLLRSLAAKGVVAESYWIANAVRVTGTAATFKSIAARSDVLQIIGSTTYSIPPVTPGAVEGAINAVEWGIANINADDVWSTYGTKGEGIVVGSIDTGVQFDHPALVNSYRGNTGGGTFNHNYNWWDPSNACASPSLVPCDNNSHGTHTVGTIAGDDGGANQIGVAPGVKWMAAKGCESSSCSDAALLGSGQFMLAPTDLLGANPMTNLRPNLVSNSWGGGGGQPWYQATVTAWVAAGMFPVFSNGNAGPSCGTAGSPGDYLNSYGVGAYDINNVIASFSSRGVNGGAEIKPNISAPGVNVRSSVPGNSYSSFNGTSMAAPHVAGVVALMLGAAPSLIGDISQTRQLLDQTAIDVSDLTCGGTAGDNNVWGEGRIDAFAAVTASPRGPVGTLSGTVTNASNGNPIAGATVAVSGTSSRTTTSGAGGAYSLTLPIGPYSVTGSSFGFANGNANVVVTTGATTTQNLALAPASTRSVNGTVRDSSAAPVAGATVSIVGTPIAPVITNGSGVYSFPAVPEGSYSAQAEPAARCLTGQTRALTVGAADVNGFDFTMANKQDAFGYRCRGEAPGFVPGANLLALTGDDATQNVALPFAFSFYGTSYVAANVTTNGLVSFTDATTQYANGAIPAAASPNTAIYAFWDDLFVDTPTSGVYTASLGVAPNRQFVIEWRNVRFFADAARRVTFEVILNENGDVQTMYQDIAADGMEMGNSATVGIENQVGTVALQYASNEAAFSTGLAVRYFIGGGGGGNVAPVANGDSGSVAEDGSVTINVLGNDTDANGDPLSVAGGSVSDPAHGTATVVAGGIQYVPDANYNGSDSFTYAASDGSRSSNLATVSVNVAAVNDVPTVSLVLLGGTTSCAGTGGKVALVVADVETAVGSLALTRSTSATKVLALSGITFGGAGAARTMTANGTGSRGTSTISVTVSDGTASSSISVAFRAGATGSNTLNGGSGPDILVGNGGNDVLRGNAGIDLLCGGSGNDNLTGGTEGDFFSGGTGTDTNTDLGGSDLSDGT